MLLQCPSCKSIQISEKNISRKVFALLGMAAGAISSFSTISPHARVDTAVKPSYQSDDTSSVSTTSAILHCIIGAIVGGTAGVALGDFMDENVLDNFECLECGHRFGAPQE